VTNARHIGDGMTQLCAEFTALSRTDDAETCEEVEVQLCAFLTLALGGGEWSVLYSGRIATGTY